LGLDAAQPRPLADSETGFADQPGEFLDFVKRLDRLPLQERR